MPEPNLKAIENENWRQAFGVRNEGESNSALASRDYVISCRIPHLIALVHGYHIWWCSAHHQPKFHCDMRIQEVALAQRIYDAVRLIDTRMKTGDNFKDDALASMRYICVSEGIELKEK